MIIFNKNCKLFIMNQKEIYHIYHQEIKIILIILIKQLIYSLRVRFSLINRNTG